MKNIAKNAAELIGNTPLVELSRFAARHGAAGVIVAKNEAFNPGGSVKDRIALAMIDDAEQRGALKPGGTIIEPTSGNTGIGLAMIGAMRGYRVILTMPDTMSLERRKILAAYGAQIVLTPGAEGMKGSIAESLRLRDAIPGAVIMGQFDNPANPAVHYRTTAEEIWRGTEGRVDIFVAGVGTGGTVSGAGRRLRELNPAVEVVAVEPLASPVLGGGAPGTHRIQGIGAGFIPRNYDAAVVDRVFAVSNEDAIRTTRELAAEEGILAGVSSGAALFAALAAALEPRNKGKRIVVVLPDTGERYLSTELFDFA